MSREFLRAPLAVRGTPIVSSVIPLRYRASVEEVLELIPVQGHSRRMTSEADDKRLKKQLENERIEILALLQRIQNFARLAARSAARTDDEGLIFPGASPDRRWVIQEQDRFRADATSTATTEVSASTAYASKASQALKTSIGPTVVHAKE
jgi:hypothetical protein